MRLCCTIVAGICAGAEQNEERFDFYFSTFKGIVVEIAMKSQEDVVLFCFLFICRDSLSFFSGGCYSLLFLSRSFAFCVENVFFFFVHLSRFFAFCPLAMEKRAPWSPLSLPCIAASRAKYSRSFLAMIRRRLDAKRYIQRTKTPWKAT